MINTNPTRKLGRSTRKLRVVWSASSRGTLGACKLNPVSSALAGASGWYGLQGHAWRVQVEPSIVRPSWRVGLVWAPGARLARAS
jgi:hypothetical protein